MCRCWGGEVFDDPDYPLLQSLILQVEVILQVETFLDLFSDTCFTQRSNQFVCVNSGHFVRLMICVQGLIRVCRLCSFSPCHNPGKVLELYGASKVERQQKAAQIAVADTSAHVNLNPQPSALNTRL